MVSTGICLVWTAVVSLRKSLKITGKNLFANMFGGNRQVAFAA